MPLLAAIYIALPVLTAIGVIPFRFRFPLLVSMTAFLAWICVGRYRMRDLGVRRDNLQRALKSNAWLVLAMLLPLIAAIFRGLTERHPPTRTASFLCFYVVVSSPCQEFIYRAIMHAELNRRNIHLRFIRLAAMSLPFALLHSIYHDWLTLGLSLVAGLLWAGVYERTPNLFGVSFYHSVIGIIAIWLGIV